MGSLGKYVMDVAQDPARTDKVKKLLNSVRDEMTRGGLSHEQLGHLLSGDHERVMTAVRREAESAGSVPTLEHVRSIIHP